jgi:hypothetical protein
MKRTNGLELCLRSIVLLLCVLVNCFDLSTTEVHASAAQIKLLDAREEDLANALKAYLDAEFWRLTRLQE